MAIASMPGCERHSLASMVAEVQVDLGAHGVRVSRHVAPPVVADEMGTMLIKSQRAPSRRKTRL